MTKSISPSILSAYALLANSLILPAIAFECFLSKSTFVASSVAFRASSKKCFALAFESIGITPFPGNFMTKSGLFPSSVFSCSVYIIPFVRLAISKILRRVISPQSPLADDEPVSAVLSRVALSPSA